MCLRPQPSACARSQSEQPRSCLKSLTLSLLLSLSCSRSAEDRTYHAHHVLGTNGTNSGETAALAGTYIRLQCLRMCKAPAAGGLARRDSTSSWSSSFQTGLSSVIPCAVWSPSVTYFGPVRKAQLFLAQHKSEQLLPTHSANICF